MRSFTSLSVFLTICYTVYLSNSLFVILSARFSFDGTEGHKNKSRLESKESHTLAQKFPTQQKMTISWDR